MTYDATLKYIIFWKVLWQRNNSSRILQEVLWSQTITKWSPKTLTKINVMFKLSNKKSHHFFSTNFSQRVRNSRNNSFTDWWLLLRSINYKYGANRQKIYFLMWELSRVRNFLTGKSWPTDTFLMGESKAKGTFLTWQNRAYGIRWLWNMDVLIFFVFKEWSMKFWRQKKIDTLFNFVPFRKSCRYMM